MNCEELQSLRESATDSGETNIERESALFLMYVSNQLSLGHSGVDTLCSCTQSFVESVSSSISNKVSRVLHQPGITDPAILADIEDACKPEDIRNHPKFLLHFLIHIDVLMLCRKFELILSSNFRVMTIFKNEAISENFPVE